MLRFARLLDLVKQANAGHVMVATTPDMGGARPMKIPPPEFRKARIEIIPMIDTIFFLLVFFMFSTLSMVKMKGLDVSAPRPNGASPARRPKKSLSLFLRRASSLWTNVRSTPRDAAGGCWRGGWRQCPARSSWSMWRTRSRRRR